jgi:hypothetical protein
MAHNDNEKDSRRWHLVAERRNISSRSSVFLIRIVVRNLLRPPLAAAKPFRHTNYRAAD